jgi:hypothetical protein
MRRKAMGNISWMIMNRGKQSSQLNQGFGDMLYFQQPMNDLYQQKFQ